MRLEDQLESLALLGVRPAPHVTVQSILEVWSREEYEEKPFELLLSLLGTETPVSSMWRPNSDRVFSFHRLCVGSPNSYARIANRLCRIAGVPDAFIDFRDEVDYLAGAGWLEYQIRGHHRRWPVQVHLNWLDLNAVRLMMDDLEHDGILFRRLDQGEMKVVLFLDDKATEALNTLSGRTLVRTFAPDPMPAAPSNAQDDPQGEAASSLIEDDGQDADPRGVSVSVTLGGARMRVWTTNNSSTSITSLGYTLVVPRPDGIERVAIEHPGSANARIVPGQVFEADCHWPESTLAGVVIKDVDCEVTFQMRGDRFVIVASTDKLFKVVGQQRQPVT
jgi:hypothetical protein